MFNDAATALNVVSGTTKNRSKHHVSSICRSALSYIYLWTSLSGAVALKETW